MPNDSIRIRNVSPNKAKGHLFTKLKRAVSYAKRTGAKSVLHIVYTGKFAGRESALWVVPIKRRR